MLTKLLHLVFLVCLGVAQPGFAVEGGSRASDSEVCRRAIDISTHDWDLGYGSREWLAEAEKRKLKLPQCLSLIGNPIEALPNVAICKRALNWSWLDWDLSYPQSAWITEADKRHLSVGDCRALLGVGTKDVSGLYPVQSGPAQAKITDINRPVTVPLIKLQYPGNPPNIDMLYINLVALGSRKISQPLLLDTGSPGITIDCDVVLPVDLCSPKGIKIKKNIELDGIMVTTQKVVAHYGTFSGYGNLAVATVAFGSLDKPIIIAKPIPVLIRYKQVRRATGEIVGGYLWPKGIFGVSPVAGLANGAIRSPMGFIRVGGGLHRGYYLSPIGSDWKVCTNERQDCPTIDALHIGIDATTKSGFKLKKWQRASSRYSFPTENMCLAWQGKSFCRPSVYDTGNSTVQVAAKPPKGVKNSLTSGSKIVISGKAHDDWTFTTRYQPEVEFVPQINYHVFGIRFFEVNSLLFDLDTGEIGFRIGH
jgi:hypothetical protein